MTLNRFVFKTHKWLAVGVFVPTAVWFVTGVVLIIPPGLLGVEGGAAARAELPPYEDVKLTIPQAVAAAQAAAGSGVKITRVGLQRLPGKLLYEISAANGRTYRIDAVSGELFAWNENSVRQVAESFLAGRGRVVEVTLEKKHTVDNTGGPLPFYRVRADDPAETNFYFDDSANSLRITTRRERVLQMFHGAHTFAILRPWMPGIAVRGLALLMTVVGTVMSLFGMWILWLQWQLWWGARKARVARAA